MSSPHRIQHDLYKSPTRINDPGDGNTITPNIDGGTCSIVTAGAETRTLAQPTKAGITVTLAIDVYVGAATVTVTGGYNQGGDTSVVLGTAADWVQFTSIKVGTSYYWRVVQQEGTTARTARFFAQDAPTAEATGAQAIAAADFVNGIVVHSVAAASALSTPTGAQIAAVLPTGITIGDAFYLHVITIGVGADDISTLTAGDGSVTFVGNVTVGPDAAGTAGYGTWIFRMTGATSFVGYRVG